MIPKILKRVGEALVLLLVLALVVYIATGAQPPEPDSSSTPSYGVSC